MIEMNEIMTRQYEFEKQVHDGLMVYLAGWVKGWDEGFSRLDEKDFFADLPDLIPLSQAAELLGIGRTKKYELLDEIPTRKFGKEYMVSRKHLAEYVAKEYNNRRKHGIN